MRISLSSAENWAPSKISQLFQWGREHLLLSIVLIVLILPFLNEVWSFVRVSYLVNQAARDGTRQAATGRYDNCFSEGCMSSDEVAKNAAVDTARLDAIHRVVYETLGEKASGGSSTGQTRVAVCSSEPGFYFDPEKNLCFPTDHPGDPSNFVTVSVKKDYLLGSSLGGGVTSLPIQAQHSLPVESFRMTRALSVLPKILVTGTNPTTIDPNSPGNAINITQQLVVVTGRLQLIANDVDTVAETITSIANTHGGYIAQSTSQFDGTKKTFNIQIHIPAEKFDAAFVQTKKLGIQVLGEDINRKDITEEYIDLEGRLRGLQATSDQLKAFLEKAKTVDEALKVNVELGRIQEQIEQVTGRKKYLESQVQFATIDIIVSEKSTNPIAPTFSWQPPATVEKAWQFLMGLVYFTGDVLIWVVIVGLPIGLVLWGIGKLLRRTFKRKA